MIKQTPGTLPIFNFSYWIDPESYTRNNKAGTFIWIEGFEKGLKRLNVVYSNDYVHWNAGGNQSQLRTVLPVHLDITADPGNWRELTLNPFGDFLNFTDDKENFIRNIDTLAINFGVWTLNEGYKPIAGAGYSDVRLDFLNMDRLSEISSTNDGESIPKKDQKYLWWFGIDHVAGDHQSIVEDLNKYLPDS